MSEYLQKLMEAIQENGKPLDMDKIERAYNLAESAHAGQMRASGEPYIIHPVETAIITVKLGRDTDTVVTALLHDVVEDTDIPIEKIRKEFGPEVALMVDGVTKLGQIAYVSREEQQAENVRKMLLAMVQDVRVIIVKLADRLHNMRTIDFMPPEKQRSKAHETMEIYAPLAHRLGIRPLMEELEDRCIRVLDPVGYNDIEHRMELEKEDRIRFLDSLKERIGERLKKENQPAYVEGRIKSIYGIYRKVYIQGRSMEEIFDIYAVRVIVESVYECYNVLGIVHDMFNPIPDRFKDYISTPKQNMYQSLHTTCIDKEGIPSRSRSVPGICTTPPNTASRRTGNTRPASPARIIWRSAFRGVRQLLEQQQESDDASELVESIKSDIAPDEVFVFTPGGDVIQLPAGSTVIDFAYAIHTAVGNRMTGAKINGRIVSLDSEVKTGMIVEIITTNAPGHGPSRDWINMAKTAGARSKIRTWLKKNGATRTSSRGKKRSGRNSAATSSFSTSRSTANLSRMSQGASTAIRRRIFMLPSVTAASTCPNFCRGRRTNSSAATARCRMWRRRFQSRPSGRRRTAAASSSRGWKAASSNLPAAAIRCPATISSGTSPGAPAFQFIKPAAVPP
jgi:GTP pyrophosphokinase